MVKGLFGTPSEDKKPDAGWGRIRNAVSRGGAEGKQQNSKKPPIDARSDSSVAGSEGSVYSADSESPQAQGRGGLFKNLVNKVRRRDKAENKQEYSSDARSDIFRVDLVAPNVSQPLDQKDTGANDQGTSEASTADYDNASHSATPVAIDAGRDVSVGSNVPQPQPQPLDLVTGANGQEEREGSTGSTGDHDNAIQSKTEIPAGEDHEEKFEEVVRAKNPPPALGSDQGRKTTQVVNPDDVRLAKEHIIKTFESYMDLLGEALDDVLDCLLEKWMKQNQDLKSILKCQTYTLGRELESVLADQFPALFLEWRDRENGQRLVVPGNGEPGEAPAANSAVQTTSQSNGQGLAALGSGELGAAPAANSAPNPNNNNPWAKRVAIDLSVAALTGFASYYYAAYIVAGMVSAAAALPMAAIALPFIASYCVPTAIATAGAFAGLLVSEAAQRTNRGA